MTEAVQDAEYEVAKAAGKLAEANGAVAAMHAAYEAAKVAQTQAMQAWKDAKVWEAAVKAHDAGATGEQAIAAAEKVANGIVVL